MARIPGPPAGSLGPELNCDVEGAGTPGPKEADGLGTPLALPARGTLLS